MFLELLDTIFVVAVAVVGDGGGGGVFVVDDFVVEN